jgi:hypothetical protein
MLQIISETYGPGRHTRTGKIVLPDALIHGRDGF